MVFRFILAGTFICPLIGIMMLEQGAFSASAWDKGYPNGAVVAFALFGMLVFAVALVLARFTPLAQIGMQRRDTFEPDIRLVGRRVLGLLLPMTIFVLFPLGGVNSIVGEVGSGEFRATLGQLGAIGYLIVKYFAPALMAYLIAVRHAAGKPVWSPDVLASAICVVLIALSFGYKAGVVIAFLPTIVLVFWNARWQTLVPIAGVGTALVALGYMMFGWQKGSLVSAMVDRIFTLQGDIAWKLWDEFQKGTDFPPYADTLLPMLGDRVFTALTGISRSNPVEWVSSHFSLLATYLAGYPADEIIRQGHNGSAHVFSEGLVAGGIAGLVVFAVLAGFVITTSYYFLENQIKAHNFILASTAAVYAIVGVMAWIIGGGLTELVHVSIVVAILILIPMLAWVSGRLVILRALMQGRLPHLSKPALD